MMTPEFHTRITEWMAECQKLVDEKHANSSFQQVLSMEELTKFVRIDIKDVNGSHCSVWAFVSKVEFSSKALGNVKVGDIQKPASYKAPAKHARGNIFDSNKGMGYIGQHGPAYLK